MSQAFLNVNDELEKVVELLAKHNVDYFYNSESNEILIKGDLIALDDSHAFIVYDDDARDRHYKVVVHRKPDSVTLELIDHRSYPSAIKEIVIPIPVKRMWYARPNLRIQFQS